MKCFVKIVIFVSMDVLRASVIISTYNKPEWLQKVLWSYNIQTLKDFEIIIADDGSNHYTKQIIDRFKELSKLKIKHVWQKDKGFRKTKILNKAILEAESDYIIFTDGDCIARQDFVETHLALKRRQYFLSGGYFKLPLEISELISKVDIEHQRCFDIYWLMRHGLHKNFKANKLTATGFKRYLLNTFTTTKATFDGMNVSGWRKDILSVNGFDERMQYGGEDRELGERLVNIGLKFKQIRYSAICVHLYHNRDYVLPSMGIANKNIRRATKKNKLVWTNFGINKELVK